ncbi:hypothetical protein CLOP_g6512 [Closterium sp. NIES-67]|nr:hypothetical protein CLOP_g6512 [Closterium sp. NIES-67]
MCSTRSPPPQALPARELDGTTTTRPLPRPVSAFDGDDALSSQGLVAGLSQMSHRQNSKSSDAVLLAARHRASQRFAAEQCSLSCDNIVLSSNTNSLSCDSSPILEPAAAGAAPGERASRIFDRRAFELNHFLQENSFELSSPLPAPSIESIALSTASASAASGARAAVHESRGRAFVRSLSGFPTTSTFESGRHIISDFNFGSSELLLPQAADDFVAAAAAPPPPWGACDFPTRPMATRRQHFPDPDPVIFLLPDGSARFFCRTARDPLLRVADVMREYPGLHVGVASGCRTSLHLNPLSVILPAPSATYFLHPPQHQSTRSIGSFSGSITTNSSNASSSSTKNWSSTDDLVPAIHAGGRAGAVDTAAFRAAVDDAADRIRGIEIQLNRFERRLRRESTTGDAPASAAAAAANPALYFGRPLDNGGDSDLVAAAAAISQPQPVDAASSFKDESRRISRGGNANSGGRDGLALSLSGPLPSAARNSLALNPLPLPLSPPESPRAASAQPPPRLHLAPATPPPAPAPASPSSPRLSSRSRTDPRNRRHRNRYDGDRDALACDAAGQPVARRSSTGTSTSRRGRGGGVYPRSSSSPSSSSPVSSSPSFSCATPASSQSVRHGSSVSLSRPSSCSSTGTPSGFSSFSSSFSSFASSTSTSPLPVSSPFSLKSASSSSPSSSTRISRHLSKSADSSDGTSSCTNPSSAVDLGYDAATGTGRSNGGSSSGSGSGRGGGRSSSKLWPACLTPPRTRGDGSPASGSQAHEPSARRHSRKAPLHQRSRSISFLCSSSSSGGGGGGGASIADIIEPTSGGSCYEVASQQALPSCASQQRRKPKTKGSRSDGELFSDLVFDSRICGEEEQEQGEVDSDAESQEEGGSSRGVFMTCGPAFSRSPLRRHSGQHSMR